MVADRETPASDGGGAGVLATLRESPGPVKALLVGVFVNRLGAFLQIYLVLFLTVKGFSELQAGSTLGVFGVGSVVGIMVGGELADRLGVRRAILLSTVGTAIFLVALPYVRNYSLLLASIAVTGLFSRIYRPAAAAMIAELTPQHRRVMIFAIQRFALNLGTTVSPLLGAALLLVSYDLLLWSQAAVALAFALIAVFVLPAGRPQPRRTTAGTTGPDVHPADHPARSRRASYSAIVADRPFLLFLVAFFINSAVYLQYISVLPLAMRDAGLGPAWFSAVIALNGFIVIAFELLGTKVVQRWPMRAVGAVGFAVLGIGLLVQAAPIGAAAFVLGALIWSLAEIIAGPTMYSYPAVIAPDGLRGRYIGIGQAVFGIGTAVGPVVGVMVWNLVGSGVWLCYGLVCALGAVLSWIGMTRPSDEQRHPKEGSSMLPERYAVLVDPVRAGAEYIPAFRDAGVEPVVVLSMSEFGPSHRHVDLTDVRHVHAFTGDVSALAVTLRSYAPLCVIAASESGVELADLLGELVVPGTGNAPEPTSARRNKYAMAMAAHKAGLAYPRQICNADPDVIETWLADSGLSGARLVVKPPSSAGGDNVHVVAAGADWRPYFDMIIGRPNKLGMLNEAVLVSEFVEGDEFMVDSYSADGRHGLVDVCRYVKKSRGDRIGLYDLIDFVPPDDPAVNVIWPFVQRVLDAVGIRNGCGHTEVFLTSRGPVLIEVAARPAGGGHQMITKLATGSNHITHTIAHRVRGDFHSGYRLNQYVCSVVVSAQNAGIWRNPEIFADVGSLRTFYAKHFADGGEVAATDDIYTMLGWVVLASPDRAAVEADYRQIKELERQVDIVPLVRV